MKKSLFKKGITLAVIVLLIGMSIPTTANILEYTYDFDIKEVASSFCLSDKRFYAVRAGYPGTCVWFDPEVPTILHDIGTFPSSNFPQGATFVEDVMWLCDTIGHIYKKDPDSPESEFVGNSGTGELIDIEYDPKAETLWGISTSNFYCINLTTGSATFVGNLGVSIFTIATDINGNMWGIGVDVQSLKLYFIDTSNWNITLIGYIEGISSISGISYEKNEGVMWCCAFNYSTFKSELWTIDTNNCAATFVGTFQEGTQIVCLAIPYNWTNLPPDPPTIDGPASGKIRQEHNYIFRASDPDGDDVRYHIDWGDGEQNWTDFYTQNTDVNVNHTYDKKGDYIITAYAQDIHGANGAESTLEVTMPKNKVFIFNFPLLSWLFERSPKAFPILRYLVGL